MAYNNRGVAYQRCYKYSKAMTDYKKSISIDRNGFQPFYNIGLTYHDMGKFQTAIKYFDSTLVLNPSHVRSYLVSDKKESEFIHTMKTNFTKNKLNFEIIDPGAFNSTDIQKFNAIHYYKICTTREWTGEKNKIFRY